VIQLGGKEVLKAFKATLNRNFWKKGNLENKKEKIGYG